MIKVINVMLLMFIRTIIGIIIIGSTVITVIRYITSLP